MSDALDLTFHAMGSDVRLLIDAPLAPAAPSPAEAGERALAFVEDFAARLSRFRADSELTALNRDPRETVPASMLLRAAARAGVWAAEHSGGLVDPTLLDALENAGYADSLDRREPAPLSEALAEAPPRRAARPSAAARWKLIGIDDAAGTITRPPGVLLDTGGTGKGLCADALAHRLAPYTRFVVDCGGDLAVGGVGAQLRPYEIEVEHPLTGEVVRRLTVGSGGVATSGLNVRVWRTPDGGFAHHLLDPSTGAPAWTGLVGATALGESALEAETLSKTALLLGPLGARRVLSRHGGVIVRDDGDVEEIGPLDGPRGVLVGLGRTA
jgi:thiamine biosynthesis lipoprotein